MNNSLKTMRNSTALSSDWGNNSSNRGNSNEEDSMSDNGPVDLVKRVKSENRSPEIEDPGEYSPNTSCYDSLAMSAYFIRKRRRGRCRYTPPYYLPDSQSSYNTSKSSQQASNSTPATKDSTTSSTINHSNSTPIHPNAALSMNAKTFRGQFSCPNCPMLFSNRDALAMHMMDSVRSQGCPGQAALTCSTTSVANQYSNNSPASLNSILPTMSTNEAVNLLHPAVASKSSSGVPLTMYACRVCGENKSSLDSLAMHMLAHAHQEHAKEGDTTSSSKLNRSLSQIASQISTNDKSVHHPNLPSIPPLCFNPIEFSSMQQAFNLAMATMTAAAATAKTTMTSNSDGSDKTDNLKEATNESRLLISPPKCHSVPLPLNNSYFGDDNITVTVSSLTPTGSEKNEAAAQCTTALKLQNDLLLRKQSLNRVDHLSKNDEVKDLSMKSEYDMDNENHHDAASNEEDEAAENFPEVDKEYGEDPDFGTIRHREYFYACRHCRMTFEDRTIYCLHMGLHNVNNPWQCNMCSKVCSGLHEFASHSLHF